MKDGQAQCSQGTHVSEAVMGDPVCPGMQCSEGSCCVVDALPCKVLDSAPLDIVTTWGIS